jgi:hypothetical protein
LQDRSERFRERANSVTPKDSSRVQPIEIPRKNSTTKYDKLVAQDEGATKCEDGARSPIGLKSNFTKASETKQECPV